MDEEKRAEEEYDFILELEELPDIQELKKRIEVGNLELNLSVIQKELQRLYQLNPDDMITKFKLMWFSKYFKDNKGLDRLRTVNNLIMKDVQGEERLNRAKSQETIIDFLVTNNIKTIEELKELNQIESLSPIEHEKLLLNRYEKQTPPPHFTIKLEVLQLKQLYTGLTESGFLPIDTDLKAFEYVFGVCAKPKDFNGLNWLKGRQYLRELLTPIKLPAITPAEMNRLVPLYFIYKGKRAELPHDRPHPERIDSKAIVRILKEATL